MKAEKFELQQESVEGSSLRRSMRSLVREIGEGIPKGTPAKEVNAIFRKARPTETRTNPWHYRVWREEVRRFLGKANGPLEKRVIYREQCMKSMLPWLRSRGFVILSSNLFHESGKSRQRGLDEVRLRKQEGLPS